MKRLLAVLLIALTCMGSASALSPAYVNAPDGILKKMENACKECKPFNYNVPPNLHPNIPEGAHTITSFDDIITASASEVEFEDERYWCNEDRQIHKIPVLKVTADEYAFIEFATNGYSTLAFDISVNSMGNWINTGSSDNKVMWQHICTGKLEHFEINVSGAESVGITLYTGEMRRTLAELTNIYLTNEVPE